MVNEKRIISGNIPGTPWKCVLKKEGYYMTRIAACSDGHQLIVGADTLLTNSLNGIKSETKKLFSNNDGIIIAVLGGIEFFSSFGKADIRTIIEDSIKLNDAKEIIQKLKKDLFAFYENFNIQGFFTQIIVFWANKYGFCAFPFEVGCYTGGFNQDMKIHVVYPNGAFIDEKYWIINHKLLLAGDGIDGGIKIEKSDYDPRIVENNINSAIQDESLPFVGGHYTNISIQRV